MSIQDRAREFILEKFPNAANDLGLTIAVQTTVAFATLEREVAVREFIEKVDKAMNSQAVWLQMGDVFREMFNKELDG